MSSHGHSVFQRLTDEALVRNASGASAVLDGFQQGFGQAHVDPRGLPLEFKAHPSLSLSLERVAKETNQDLTVLVTETLENFVQTEEEELAGIERAEEDIKTGRVVAHERVVEWLKTWGTGRVPPPLCK